MTIATIADIHHGPAATGHGAEQKLTDQALDLTNRFIDETNGTEGVEAVLGMGDLIQHSGTSTHADEQSLREVVSAFDRSTVPVLHAAGNHDLMNLTQETVAKVLRQPGLYFSQDIGEHHVVVLHSHSPNRDGSQIAVDREQIQWLERDLKTTDRPTMVVVHHPLSDQDLTGNLWFEDYPQCALVENRDEVRGVLEASGKVIAVLNGHTHWNRLEVEGGIPYVTQQSLVENVGNSTPANASGLITLKGSHFGMELYGNNPGFSHERIATETGATYDSIARAYREETAQYGKPECDEFDALMGLVTAEGPQVIVDFGCGPARDAGHFQSRGFQYVGVDASTEFIKHARSAVPDGTFYQGDFSVVEMPRNSASVAWHSSSLQHVKREALAATLQKAYDTLKPGGVFYAHYRSGQGESIQISSEYGTPIARFIALYEEAEMNKALQDCGFEIVSSRTFDHKYSGLKGKTVKYKTKVIARKPA